jgi:hypothetical protein
MYGCIEYLQLVRVLLRTHQGGDASSNYPSCLIDNASHSVYSTAVAHDSTASHIMVAPTSWTYLTENSMYRYIYIYIYIYIYDSKLHATHAKSMSPVNTVLLLTAKPVASERNDATIIKVPAQVRDQALPC